MPDKMCLTIMSGSIDRLTGAAVLVSAAVSMDMEVEIFLQLWGVHAFRKDVMQKNMNLAEFGELGEQVAKRMQELKLPMWFELLKQAKELGKVKIYACSLASNIWGVKKEDLEMVDEIIGAGEWVEKMREAKINLFI
ncbi:MAG: DsrE/DsrF/DrsH-like family protein [Desulfurococcales archaeon]|nr:DsrE/DsrF/DrsH-like family protein [Desulfurococcales archaeon]